MEIQSVYREAAYFAELAHFGQFRADGVTPYIHHPLAVSLVVRENEGSEAAYAAAVLHDVLEDCDVNAVELRLFFGEAVAGLVVEVSFPDDMPDRRAVMLNSCASMSPEARLIKLADCYVNLGDLPRSGWSEDKALRYFRHLLAMRIALDGTSPELEQRFDSRAVEVGLYFGF